MDIIDHDQYDSTQQLKLLARQSKIARIIMLVYVSGLLLFWVCYSFHFKVIDFEYPRLAVLSGVLIMTICSFYKPFIPMVMLSVAVAVYFCVDIPAIAREVSGADGLDTMILAIDFTIWAIRLIVAALMAKGAIAAWKWQQLKKEMV